MSGPRTERTGTRYRWTGARATFFVPGTAETLVLPIRRGGRQPQQVTIRVNGQDADRLVLDDGKWRELRYPLRRALNRPFHRVEVLVSPLVPGRGTGEPVGVKLGVPRY